MRTKPRLTKIEVALYFETEHGSCDSIPAAHDAMSALGLNVTDYELKDYLIDEENENIRIVRATINQLP